jgi:hypothetical protein
MNPNIQHPQRVLTILQRPRQYRIPHVAGEASPDVVVERGGVVGCGYEDEDGV